MLDEIIKNSIKKDGGYLIKVKIVANSKKNSYEFVDTNEYKLKLKISKPAVDGKANDEIVKYLAGCLQLPKSNIKIVKGEKSSIKGILVKV